MPVTVSSDWLTAARLARLCTVLRQLPSIAPGIPTADVVRATWNACGGPFDEVRQLIEILSRLGLIIDNEDAVRRNKEGDRVARAVGKGDLTELGIFLVRAGCFHDQARLLIESGELAEDGSLHCSLKAARGGAPQLLGVLQWWEEVQIRPIVRIPKRLLDELNTVWALIPPPVELPKWAAERKEIGNRAEMYTVQVERLRAGDPSHICWVGRDSDSLGWDVEDRGRAPHRRIEVKGSREPEPLFFLSENEWKKAHDLGPEYEVQFWGEVDLSRPPANEFKALLAAGYPIVIPNIAAAIAAGSWKATAVRWRVCRA